MKRLILACLILFGTTSLAIHAQTSIDQTILAKQAYQKLLKMDTFAIGGTGYSGETSAGEKELDSLLKEIGAVPALRLLVREGTNEGSLYGLVGLNLLGCDCYQEELTWFRKNRIEAGVGPIREMSGCSVANFIDRDQRELFFDKFFPSALSHKNRMFQYRQKR
jgi:hypothetical protein